MLICQRQEKKENSTVSKTHAAVLNLAKRTSCSRYNADGFAFPVLTQMYNCVLLAHRSAEQITFNDTDT